MNRAEKDVSPSKQLGAAAAVGLIAGGVVIFEGTAAAATAAAVSAIAGLLALGPERVALMAWAATAFTVPWSGVRVGSIALSDAFLILAVAFTLPSFATGYRKSPVAVHRGVFVGLGAIAFGGVIGTFVAARPDTSMAVMVKFIMASAGSVAAVSLWAPTRSQIRWFCSLWLAGAVANALWAISVNSSVGGRPPGLSTHPNHLGMVCLLGSGLALGLVLSGARAGRGLAIAALPALLVGLLVSGSRAALVGYLVMVPAVALLSRRVQLGARALFVVAVLGVAVVAGVMQIPEQSGLGRLVGGPTSTESNAERVEHLSRSLQRFQRHPLTGEGFEYAQEAHNIYLQVASSAGPLGLLGLVLVARSVLAATRRDRGRDGGPLDGDRALLAGLVGGYIGYLVTGAFQNVLWDRYLWLYVAATLVLAGTLGNDASRSQRPPASVVAPGRFE